MEDNKIIKALECCRDAAHNPDFCYECPYAETENCTILFAQDTLDLINQQQSEIKRQHELLEIANTAMKIANENANLMCEQYKRAKVEAIEEFVERLKDISDCRVVSDGEYVGYDWEDVMHYVDNLVKEMAGDTE